MRSTANTLGPVYGEDFSSSSGLSPAANCNVAFFETRSNANTALISVFESAPTIYKEVTPKAAALRFAEKGIPVFPCRPNDDSRTGKKAKSPLIEGGFKNATIQNGIIRSWWSKWPDAAIGMPTGAPTGTFVVDLDIREGSNGEASLAALERRHDPLPVTYRVRTPSGGEHIYFSMPDGVDVRCSSGKIGHGIDIRANGGYVIVPPSRLSDEDDKTVGCYEWTEGSPSSLAEPPDWLIALINERPIPTFALPQQSQVSAASLIKADLDDVCATVASAQPGTRNDTLNKAAFAVGRAVSFGRIEQDAAKQALISAAQACGLDESEASSTISSGIEAGLNKLPKGSFFADKNAKGGTDTRSLRNVTIFLAQCGVSLRWNAFVDRYELIGLKGHFNLCDRSVADLWGRAHEINFRIDKGFLRDCLEFVALQNVTHPVREYLDGLANKWDQVERLDMWLAAYLKAEENDYTSAVGAKTLIAAVRRIRQPGTKFDQLLILEGDQGTGKSSALKILAGQEAWFTDCVSLTNDSKVLIEQTSGKLLVEVPELKGMRKAEIEHVKATLSRTHDRARRAYGRYTDEVPRQFILIGTTNTEKGGECWYLKDPTGNRRFWPVRTGEIDLEGLQRDRDQLWAEAVAREAAGEPVELPKELWKEAEREQQARMETDPWVEELSNELGDLEGKLLTSDARLIVSRNLANWGAVQNERLGRAMRDLGWERKELRTGQSERGRSYFYVKGEQPWCKVIVNIESNSQVRIDLDRRGDG